MEYRCSCSRERVSRASRSAWDVRSSPSLIAEQGQADLSCQFCDKVYHFSKEELEGLLVLYVTPPPYWERIRAGAPTGNPWGLLPAFYLFSSMRYCSIKWEAVAPSAVAVTICRRGLGPHIPHGEDPRQPGAGQSRQP
ncbi:MAG: Hsp33 family molecular chaperone HslO [Lawsonibacter sp.]